MPEELVGTRTNKRQIGNFGVLIPIFLEILTFNLDEDSFPRTNSMSRIRICYWFSLAITFKVPILAAKVNIFDQKSFTISKIKNSMCGEVRSTKFFQNLKELIKTRLVMYFSTQTDEMPMRTTRITDLFNIQEGSKSPSGGNQVDGLPSAWS